MLSKSEPEILTAWNVLTMPLSGYLKKRCTRALKAGVRVPERLKIPGRFPVNPSLLAL